MTIESLGAVVASFLSSPATLIAAYRRARQNALIISYLEGMPDYLQRDIGLPIDADVRRAIDSSRTAATSDRDVQRHIGLTCGPV